MPEAANLALLSTGFGCTRRGIRGQRMPHSTAPYGDVAPPALPYTARQAAPEELRAQDQSISRGVALNGRGTQRWDKALKAP